MEEQSQLGRDLTGQNVGVSFRWDTDEEEQKKPWDALHNAYHAAMALKLGCEG